MGGMCRVVAADAPRGAADKVEASGLAAKVDYLLRIAEWVSWPDNALSEADDVFVIGLVGRTALADEIRGSKVKKMHGRPIEVREFKGALEFRGRETPGRRQESLDSQKAKKNRDLQNCHLVFVGAGEERVLPFTLKAVENASVLTIGETPNFAAKGGMVGLVGAPPDLKLEINTGAVRRAGLQVSPRLLNLARIVGLKGKDWE
jgi:hypothetical protein